MILILGNYVSIFWISLKCVLNTFLIYGLSLKEVCVTTTFFWRRLAWNMHCCDKNSIAHYSYWQGNYYCSHSCVHTEKDSNDLDIEMYYKVMKFLMMIFFIVFFFLLHIKVLYGIVLSRCYWSEALSAYMTSCQRQT